jgi:Flp pilus assembly protein TadG
MKSTRQRKRGQTLVIIALSATVLFGIIALGLDAGRLYFFRRDVQNAADSGALAGAQELVTGTGTSGPVGLPAQEKARYQAAVYAFATFGATPAHDFSSPGYWAADLTEYAAGNADLKVKLTTPYSGQPNEIEVEFTNTVPVTFASIMGFTKQSVYAQAVAHGGNADPFYALFGTQAGGSGNNVKDDQNGNAQIDDGQSGTDICSPSGSIASIVSNAKIHTPNPTGGYLGINGPTFHVSAHDTHGIKLYWADPSDVTPNLATPLPVPSWQPPSKPALAPAPTSTTLSGGGSWTFNGDTFHNPTGSPIKFHIYSPGLYMTPITIPAGGDYYIFQNGVYYLQGVSFTIAGGTVSNTSDGAPHMKVVGPGSFVGGFSDLNPIGGADGVEFVLDGSSTFSASGNPSVFLVAPTMVPNGQDSIVFFIPRTNLAGSNAVVWDTSGLTPSTSSFRLYGTIYDTDDSTANAYPHGSRVQVQAVSNANYTVTGEVVAPQVWLFNGGFPGSLPASSNCAAGYHEPSPPAGKLIQFNIHYAPHFRGTSYLVH